MIIGKWLMVSRTFNGTTYSEKDRGLIWEFYQDNTASIDAIDGLTSETTWYIYEDLLTFGPETIYKIKELTLDSLVLTFPNDQSVLITFEKKDEKEQNLLTATSWQDSMPNRIKTDYYVHRELNVSLS